MRSAIVVCACASWLLLPAGAQVNTQTRDALASRAETYEALLADRAAEILVLEASLGDARAELQARIVERDALAARLSSAREQERATEASIADLDAQLSSTATSIERERVTLSQLQGRISALLVSLHRQRAGRSLDALVRATSLHDLRVTNVYLSLLSDQDVRLVADVDAQLEVLASLEAQLAAQRAEADVRRGELAQARARLEEATSALEAAIDALNATEAGIAAQRAEALRAQEQLERDLADTASRLAAEIARLEAEERRLRAEAAAFAEDRERRDSLEAQAVAARERILALSSPQQANDLGFVAPLDGGRLVSRFREGNNSFVALRASQPGAAVFAVQAGVVIASQSIGANDGWMVAVRHGAGLVTVYTNLREPPVLVGDRVARGQGIGFLGGGTLPPPDVLRLYARVDEDGRDVFVDPLPILGL